MALTANDISLLMKYGGYSFDDIKRMPEQEQDNALMAIKNWIAIEPDNKKLWGLEEAQT